MKYNFRFCPPQFQYNVQLKSNLHLDYLHEVRDSLLPVFYADEAFEIDDASLDVLKDKVMAQKEGLEVLQWVILAIGCVAMILGICYNKICLVPVTEEHMRPFDAIM